MSALKTYKHNRLEYTVRAARVTEENIAALATELGLEIGTGGPNGDYLLLPGTPSSRPPVPQSRADIGEYVLAFVDEESRTLRLTPAHFEPNFTMVFFDGEATPAPAPREEYHAAKALSLLPDAEAHRLTADQRIAVALVHATLALAAARS